MLQSASLLAVHADWSVSSRKRWMTRGRRTGGVWRIEAPAPVEDAATLLARLRAEAAGAAVAFGGDFPLGLPRAYAALAGIADFAGWLRGLTGDEAFFSVCDRLEDVCVERPFYPRARSEGAAPMKMHMARLGLEQDQFRRVVDHRVQARNADGTSRGRPAGAPLFWTLGPNQCGKGALNAWRTCLLPAMRDGVDPRLWPYDGGFVELLRPGAVVIAETYPAEAMFQFGLRLVGSKRRQESRRALATALFERMKALAVVPTDTLATSVTEGFGDSADGEDRMDSLLGLLCVIRICDGAPDGVPDDPAIRSVEGWVLGQDAGTIFRPPASLPPKHDRPPLPARRSPPADRPAAGSG
ncbi:MAG: hypothetical protein ACYCZB_09810 [Acidiphilium sp.]